MIPAPKGLFSCVGFAWIMLRLLGAGSGMLRRRETEWPGWIWCTNDSGKSTWVPESWVQIDGDSCVLRRDCVVGRGGLFHV